jgi:hypothetical protein
MDMAQFHSARLCSATKCVMTPASDSSDAAPQHTHSTAQRTSDARQQACAAPHRHRDSLTTTVTGAVACWI